MRALGWLDPNRWLGENAALYVILYACLLHYAWAGLLAYSPDAGHSTPVAGVIDVVGGRWQAVAVFGITALLAQIGVMRRKPMRLRSLMLLPQQIVLLISAEAGLHAVIAGHYADGVLRPWPFILSDQLPMILVALLYTSAILVTGRRHAG